MTKTINWLKNLLAEIYLIPDDRIHEIEDYFYYIRKFLIRFLSDQKKGSSKIINLNIALSWLVSLSNRFHIDIDKIIYRRYSHKCPFCLEMPCYCSSLEPKKAKKTGRPTKIRPKSLSDWQRVIKKIYPEDEKEKIFDLLFSDLDKTHFCYRKFKKELGKSKFKEVEVNLIDYFVLMIRMYNILEIDISEEFTSFFFKGCWVCKKTPCECFYSE